MSLLSRIRATPTPESDSAVASGSSSPLLSQTMPPLNGGIDAEVRHWNDVTARMDRGERLFWLSHPEIHRLHTAKKRIDGLSWQEWVVRRNGGPVKRALELGCGRGLEIEAMVRSGVALTGVGVDLDESSFKAQPSLALDLRAADINRIQLEPNSYDLIYAMGSFHHFDALEHIMDQVHGALTGNGVFLLDEYVGPPRFQWTDLQLSYTADLLALMPQAMRRYSHGMIKTHEGRSTPEEVIHVCPSEAIRSDEIVPLFEERFRVLHHGLVGGTIQHLLYSGIAQNFPDHVPETDRMIRAVDSIETRLIESGILPSDFVLLAGAKHT